MNYELIKNEFIKLKREELNYIDSITKISSNKILSELEKLEIYRKLNNYEVKLNEILKRFKSELLNDKQLSVFKKIGIIDHHRKNDDGTIPNPTYYYSEPAASSSVEVIFTLLEFSEYELNISDSEATWMLLGIVVDTNNFVYRSSNMTFEIAALLAKKQASMGRVKEYLKEKKSEKLTRNKFISEIEVYRGNTNLQ